MSEKLVYAKGTTSQRTARAWNIGVLFYDTDLSCLFIGDGSTAGGVHASFIQQAALAEVDDSLLPSDGTIGGLSVSDPPTQGEVQALRDECEHLRDVLANVTAYLDNIHTRLESSGLMSS